MTQSPRLDCGIVLHSGEEGCRMVTAGQEVCVRCADRGEDAQVELAEVGRLYTEHGWWDAALGAAAG